MKVIITGSSGFLGGYLTRVLSRSADVLGVYHSSQAEPGEMVGMFRSRQMDITDRDGVYKVFEAERPDAVVHCAALATVSGCAANPDLARKVNVLGTSYIAAAAGARRAYYVYLSTDMVFDGEAAPYAEDAKPTPLSIYGATKSEAEKFCPPGGLVVRTALTFGARKNAGRPFFFEEALQTMARGGEAKFFHDEWRTPLWADDLARIFPLLLDTRPSGILHIGGPERMTRVEMATRACNALGINPAGIKSLSRLEDGAQRPRDLSLDTKKLRGLCPNFEFTNFEDAVKRSNFKL